MHTSRSHKYLGGAAFLLATVLLGFTWMETPEPRPTTADGEAIYMSRCMSCHQTDGAGIAGVFPPLDGTDWVTGDKGRLIRIILNGMQGETKVKGTVYSGAMPPWKTFLSDEEVADVLTYIRTSWSNEASAVTQQEVASVRKATKDRTSAWTAEELEDKANQGIPGVFDFLAAPPDTTSGQ